MNPWAYIPGLPALPLWSFLLAVILSTSLCSHSATAQKVSAAIDVSGSQVRYSDSIQLGTAALTPSIRLAGRQATLDVIGSYSISRDGRWGLQGIMAAAWFTPSIGRASGEIALLAGGTTNRDGTNTTQAILSGRLHMSVGTGGVWLGAGRGIASDTLNRQKIVRGEIGGWARWASGTGSIMITPTRLHDSLSYTDAQIALQWEWPRLTVGVSGSGRSGHNLPSLGEQRKTWGDISITAPLIQRLALVASAGTYPVDWTQGFPGGRYATVGVRVNLYETRTTPDVSLPTIPALSDDMVMRAISDSSGYTKFSIKVRKAESIEIIGDFTNWQAIPLIRDTTGWWSITLPIKAGVHQMNVRLDGGPWRIPKGLTPFVDEFGGSVGIITIPASM